MLSGRRIVEYCVELCNANAWILNDNNTAIEREGKKPLRKKVFIVQTYNGILRINFDEYNDATSVKLERMPFKDAIAELLTKMENVESQIIERDGYLTKEDIKYLYYGMPDGLRMISR